MKSQAVSYLFCQLPKRPSVLYQRTFQSKCKHRHIQTDPFYLQVRFFLWHNKKPRFHRTGFACRKDFCKCSSWYFEQASPTSHKSLITVFFTTSQMRAVARIEFPSTRHFKICVRFSRLSLFMGFLPLKGCLHNDLILERLRIVKRKMHRYLFVLLDNSPFPSILITRGNGGLLHRGCQIRFMSRSFSSLVGPEGIQTLDQRMAILRSVH